MAFEIKEAQVVKVVHLEKRIRLDVELTIPEARIAMELMVAGAHNNRDPMGGADLFTPLWTDLSNALKELDGGIER